MLNEINSRNVSKFAMFLENENLKINILEKRQDIHTYFGGFVWDIFLKRIHIMYLYVMNY